MTAAATHSPDISLNLIEAGMTLIAVFWALAFPRLGSRLFAHVESTARPLALRKGLAVGVVGLTAVLMRLAILPFCPAPLPFSPNDFSFLLAADTFAHGRLANPTPAMWTHFETIHVTMQPAYASMYFPLQGLLLAAGKLLFGNPWFALVCASGLMCAAICWMLQAWLPQGWALLGGFLAVIRLGLFSYWINTYSGGGLLSALGGALVLGALPRLTKAKTIRHRDGLLLAVGIALLAMTRPYEGLLLCLPVAGALGYWIFRGKNRPRGRTLFRQAALPLAIVILAGVWLGYYDYRAFGSPATLPYTVDRATYAVAPYYVWQSQRPDPGYRHPSMRRFYYESELAEFKKVQTPAGIATHSLLKVCLNFLFFAGFALLPALFMMRRVLLDSRVRFLVLCVAVLVAGMSIQIYYLPHYVAPFTAAFYAIGLQGMRHLRLWRSAGQPVGLAIVRLTVLVCFVLAGVRLFAGPLHIRLVEWPSGEWIAEWYGPGIFGQERASIETKLENLPGDQLAIVHYSEKHNPMDEWVYNAAGIDSSKVIWAQDMDPRDNAELVAHYKNRQIWLVEPDTIPAKISPYSATNEGGSKGALLPR
jgi:hypothetical protein